MDDLQRIVEDNLDESGLLERGLGQVLRVEALRSADHEKIHLEAPMYDALYT